MLFSTEPNLSYLKSMYNDIANRSLLLEDISVSSNKPLFYDLLDRCVGNLIMVEYVEMKEVFYYYLDMKMKMSEYFLKVDTIKKTGEFKLSYFKGLYSPITIYEVVKYLKSKYGLEFEFEEIK